jgi:hypothetical protein
MALDWSQSPRPGKHPGQAQWRVGIPGHADAAFGCLDNREVGASIGEIMDWFHLWREQIVAVIEFAARSLDEPPVPPPGAGGRC